MHFCFFKDVCHANPGANKNNLLFQAIMFHQIFFSHPWICMDKQLILTNIINLLMSPSANFYVFRNLLTRSLFNSVTWLLRFKHLNINWLSLIDMYSKKPYMMWVYHCEALQIDHQQVLIMDFHKSKAINKFYFVCNWYWKGYILFWVFS